MAVTPTTTKSTPIQFRPEMIEAILEGRKTQTRRLIKDDPPARSRFGKPGDLMWVRETHAIVPRTAYAQSDGVQQTVRPDDNYYAAIYRNGWQRSHPGVRWRSPIYMPRWAARITLEITDVRAERVVDISKEDAIAEGISAADSSPLDSFERLWDAIYGRGSWCENPLVWVIEFKLMTGATA